VGTQGHLVDVKLHFDESFLHHVEVADELDQVLEAIVELAFDISLLVHLLQCLLLLLHHVVLRPYVHVRTSAPPLKRHTQVLSHTYVVVVVGAVVELDHGVLARDGLKFGAVVKGVPCLL
jgi:hypothetical protein